MTFDDLSDRCEAALDWCIERSRDLGSWLLGLPWRLQQWLAVRLEYRELTREEAARELLIASINTGELAGKADATPRPRPGPFALPRRSTAGVLDLTRALPELRKRWKP